MKVMIDHTSPFMLAHGGFQTQIEQTRNALLELGVDVDWLRWWDDRQMVDLIHYFGIPPLSYLRQAASKGIPVVVTHLLTEQCNRSESALAMQGGVIRMIRSLPGGKGLAGRLGWESLRTAPRLVVGLECEKKALEQLFEVDGGKISLVPLGLHQAFLDQPRKMSRKGDFLISTGTITERKRSVELAEMAREAGVPILFVGKPYSEKDPYWMRFQKLVDGRTIRYKSHVETPEEMAALLSSAKGFVLFSTYENWCLSAHEAAACGLPICLPDMHWSRECFPGAGSYLDPFQSPKNPAILNSFYAACASALPPARCTLVGWREVATRLLAVYKETLSRF
jgi:glycosyltransferase involved in cell wall biosynthesis